MWIERLTLLFLALLLPGLTAARGPKANVNRVTVNRVPVQELSFGEPYINHDYHNQNYDINGDTVLSRKACLLTSDSPGQGGWLVASRRLLPENAQIEIEFRLDGEGKSMYGDGLAIWLLDPGQQIKSGQVFGVNEELRGAAVVVDTYRNNRPGKAFPYVVFLETDGTRKLDLEHDEKADELAGFSARGLHSPAQEVSILRITYQKGGALTVDINYNGKWEPGFSLFHNLKNPRQLAISASTGQLSENVHIKRIQVFELDPLPESQRKYAPSRAEQQLKSSKMIGKSQRRTSASSGNRKGSWRGTLWRLMLWMGALAGLFYGFRWYQNQRDGGRGRNGKFSDMNLRY